MSHGQDGAPLISAGSCVRLPLQAMCGVELYAAAALVWSDDDAPYEEGVLRTV